MKPLEFVVIGEDMEFVELNSEEDPEPFNLDEFLNYWALQADPRYQEDKKLFDMEQACGGGDY